MVARESFDLPGEPRMFDFQDLFQWDRFIVYQQTDTRNETGNRLDFLGSREDRRLTKGAR
jgi:hypothetical protein